MADKRHVDTRKQVNAILADLGLEPNDSPNASSETAERLVHDIASGYQYVQTLVRGIPQPPARISRNEVRSFLLLIYEWADFLLAACSAFEKRLEETTYGQQQPGLSLPLSNILHELYAGLGVTLNNVVYPRAFSDCARRWTAEERAEAVQAIARAQSALTSVILGTMEEVVVAPAAQIPTLSEIEIEIAELVFREGPLTAKQITHGLPPGRETSVDNVLRIFSKKLTKHYGFWNPRDRRGYRAPKERTWE